MNIIEKKYLNAMLNAKAKWNEFMENEDGDTNFISMLLIIGIVVVLAAAFLTLAKTTVLGAIQQKIQAFLDTI